MKKDLYWEIREAVREAIATVYDTATSECDVYVTKSGEIYTEASFLEGQCDDDDTYTLYIAKGWAPTRTEIEDSGYYCEDCLRDESGDVVELCESCQEAFVDDYTLSLEEWGEIDRMYNEAVNFIE